MDKHLELLQTNISNILTEPFECEVQQILRKIKGRLPP